MPGAHAITWPADSLESQLRLQAELFQSEAGKEGNYVSEIIYWWLGHDHQYPWKAVGNLIYAGLAKRGLLEEAPGARSKQVLYGKSGLVLPAQTAALARQQPVEPVRQLLATCRHTRPEVWNALIQGINKGLGERRNRSDW